MSNRRKSVSPSVKKSAVGGAVAVPVTVPAETPTVEVKAEVARPVPCFRCGRTGEGLLCRRCGVVLHGKPGEVNLYMKPVNPTIGY